MSRVRRVWAAGLILACLSLACAGNESTPRAVDGELDLSAWNFEEGGDVALVGTWAICWNQLLLPGEPCPSVWQAVPVRGLWDESASESPFGGRGFATYRLRVELPSDPGALAIVAGGPISAHRLWINGVDRGGLGVVGRSAEETRSEVYNRLYDVDAPGGELQLHVQVANFDFRGGGLRRIWFLGHADSIQLGAGRAVLRESMVFAAGVVVGLGYLILFAFRPSERARGYFGLMALAIGLRAVPASISQFGELMAPWLDWNWIVRAEYLGMAIAYYAAVGYARTKVPHLMPFRTMRMLQVIAAAFAAIIVFAPMSLVLETLPLQWLLPTILIVLVAVCYGRAWQRGVPGGAITTVTVLLYAGFVVHDIVRSAQSDVGAPIELFPYAMVLWILAEAFQLLRGLHRSLEKVETLSDELSEANFELQESEAAIVRFVPFDFLRSLGKESLRDVQPGDRARTRMSVLHCSFRRPATRSGGSATDSCSDCDDADFELLNTLVGQIEPCIFYRGGFLSEYRGDGFEAFFPEGPDSALEAAREIVDVAEAFAATPEGAARPPIEVHIGIDTGDVQLGTTGSGEHLVRGVVGVPIDRAIRIAAHAAKTGARILASASTRAGLGGATASFVEDQALRIEDGARAEAAVYAVRRGD